MIDWKDFAIKNGLTDEEFKKEILNTACLIAAIDIDSQDYATGMSFTCSDEIGPLVMIIKRPTH
jgi:hypothetical protein